MDDNNTNISSLIEGGWTNNDSTYNSYILVACIICISFALYYLYINGYFTNTTSSNNGTSSNNTSSGGGTSTGNTPDNSTISNGGGISDIHPETFSSEVRYHY